jgi:hypothetical protein
VGGKTYYAAVLYCEAPGDVSYRLNLTLSRP